MHPNDIMENPNRRRYHLVAGSIVCTAVYAIVLIGVRTVMS